jgi:mono/diheme cytochrome c family protein
VTRRSSRTLIAVLAFTTVAACRRGPQPRPADPMLDAIRAEEREGNLTYAESQGRSLFIHYCATCHGDSAHGDGQNASNLNPPPPDMTASRAAKDPAFVRRVITDGSAAVGRSPLSPPWGRSLSPQQVDYLVAYCEAIGKKTP